MSRLFLRGSEAEMIVEKENREVEIEGYTSEPILCDESEREATARAYLSSASTVNKPGRIFAADYGPTPDGLGITVTLWFRTPKELQ